jgi:choline-phosphate cytidylyltransferase
MIKVITYGTFDLLHYGHIRLLERAKSLGDYLIVGVTSDDFDKGRGKINVKQSLIERIEAVKNTGLADEIIVEEYEGQKIDDIKRLCVDIFTVGSDWKGHFDYLDEYCKVVYLDRTEGVSSSGIRAKDGKLKFGLYGNYPFVNRVYHESRYVNGIQVTAFYTNGPSKPTGELGDIPFITDDFDEFLEHVNCFYLYSNPSNHFNHIRQALEKGVHVLCESPIVTEPEQFLQLEQIAKEHHCVLVDALRTAYAMAYFRLLLLLKGGIIGDIVSVDSICTALRNEDLNNQEHFPNVWNSICEWGPTAMLPIFQILGVDYKEKTIVSRTDNAHKDYDYFTKVSFVYPHAVASLKVGKGAKSEGELIISGTEGYIYVPAPWWMTDYFEARFEDTTKNKRYFYQLDGEGIRYELVAFKRAIESGICDNYIDKDVSKAIIKVINDFYHRRDFIQI